MLRLLCLAFLLLGCSGGGPPQSISWQDLKSPETLKGKNVIIEGYPGVAATATYVHKGQMSFFLLDAAVGVTSSAQNSVPVDLPAGEAPNQASLLPDPFTSKDLKVHCVNGLATTKDKIRLEGRVELNYGAPTIRAKRIEKLP